MAGVLERGHEVGVSCGKLLAMVVGLSCSGACRSPGLAGMRGASASFLGMPWLASPASSSCRGLVSFPASSSCRGLGLNTLFLNGSKVATEGLGGHSANLAVSLVGRYQSNPGKDHWTSVKIILRGLRKIFLVMEVIKRVRRKELRRCKL